MEYHYRYEALKARWKALLALTTPSSDALENGTGETYLSRKNTLPSNCPQPNPTDCRCGQTGKRCSWNLVSHTMVLLCSYYAFRQITHVGFKPTNELALLEQVSYPTRPPSWLSGQRQFESYFASGIKNTIRFNLTPMCIKHCILSTFRVPISVRLPAKIPCYIYNL